MMTPMNMVTFILIFMSVVMSISTKHILILWLTLEINTLGFLMNLSADKKKEKLLVFFLFQSLASIAMMVFLFLSSWSVEQNKVGLMVFLVVWSIFMKIGMFPFQNWMVETLKNFSWVNITILLTWQKIIPIIFLMKSSMKMNMSVALILSMMAMATLMVSLSHMKKLILLSSLIHNGWLILPMKMFKIVTNLYLVVYSLVLSSVNYYLMKNSAKTLYSQSKEKHMKMEMMMLMFSLAGMPPTVGFMLKLLVVFSALKFKTHNWVVLSLMIVTLISFYVYCQVFFKNMSKNKSSAMEKMKPEKNQKMWAFWLNILTPIMIMI